MALNKKKYDTQRFTDCIRSNSEKLDSKNKQKFTFLLISANKDLLYSGFQTCFSWNNNYRSITLWYISTGSKIVVILVKSVMKTTDASKLFLAIFERTYDGLYICYFLWLQYTSIKHNDSGCNVALPHVKRTLRNTIKK